MKASLIINQLATLIAEHGDHDVTASIDGNTHNIPDDYTLFSSGWVDPQLDKADRDDAPFALELGDFV